MKGNGKYGVILWEHELQTSSWTRLMQLMQNLEKQVPWSRPGAAEASGHCMQEICIGRNSAAFHPCSQKHVSETHAIVLLFMPPSDLLNCQADYRKLSINPKVVSTLKTNPGVWRDEGPALVIPPLFCERSPFPQQSNITFHPYVVSQRTRLNLAQH